MEASRSTETSVTIYPTTWRHIREDDSHIFTVVSREILKERTHPDKILGFHSGKHLDCGLLGYALCGPVGAPMIRRNMLAPSSGRW